ncbi:unnamed protein product [Vitrella brassicaformis CCMP3155]|uniref:Uncharacterized protein n=1 Tax=Vitrella brassicaformis (strain CCMP3155) TaxID=1169540 RepID=A0A0G4GXZ8_VITBC|nr:unnamed protein product [Vitrella brassicaformis CCMP3155]|eukprot:CEM36004.1 unnamed protein product [Vitrella brassicaformis CCMP3155]
MQLVELGQLFTQAVRPFLPQPLLIKVPRNVEVFEGRHSRQRHRWQEESLPSSGPSVPHRLCQGSGG